MPQIKIILAGLLFLCLAKMPYGYYELVRFIAMVSFAVLGYQAYLQKRQFEALIYIVLALLFQPFFKIALSRGIWNMVDVIGSIYLLFSIFIKFNNSNNKEKKPYKKLNKI